MFRRVFLLVCLAMASPLSADEIRVAVASNFHAAMNELAKRFEHDTGHRVLVSAGSTGKHYAQIVQGAPFHAFFAADVERPALLEEKGIVALGERFTYAYGRLILWSPDEQLIDERGDVLASDRFRFLSVANPKFAPYGLAAKQILQGKGVWERLQSQIVRGENVGQAFQFVKSGNADLGFVAYSQVKDEHGNIAGSYWMAPDHCYQSIEQQAVVLRGGEAVRSFVRFVRSDEGRQLITDFGYIAPNVE